MERNDFRKQYLENDSDRLKLVAKITDDIRGCHFMLDKLYLQATLDAILVGISYSPEGQKLLPEDNAEGVLLTPLSIYEACKSYDEAFADKTGLKPKYVEPGYPQQVLEITEFSHNGVEQDNFKGELKGYVRLKVRSIYYVSPNTNN